MTQNNNNNQTTFTIFGITRACTPIYKLYAAKTH